MAKINLNLEAVKEEGESKYSKVPAGLYSVAIQEIEVKETKSGGHYLEMAFNIMEGEHQGKLLVDRVNINVPGSEKATGIGLGRLKRIALCTQAKNPSMIGDTDELLTGKSFKVDVHLVPNEYDGKTIEISQIRKFFTDEESTPTTAKTSAPKTEAKTDKKKPWVK